MTTNVRRALFTRIWVEHPHAYHGLGVGSPSLLADYPWYSADALTWDYQGIFWRTDGDTVLTLAMRKRRGFLRGTHSGALYSQGVSQTPPA